MGTNSTEHTILVGDVSDVLRGDIGVFDACLSDPPYGLSFMGKSWDGCVPDSGVWSLVREHLKPGAMCLAFGGTRTYHRLAVAIEGAVFEIRDSLMWLYGSGFPKSHDISKAIDKAEGAEREVLGVRHMRSPNTTYGNGHGTNLQTLETVPATDEAVRWHGYGTALKPIALTEYLANLILPPPRDTPRRLLVPFSGAGSEMIGALRAGWDEVVGIELSQEYADIAHARIAHWTAKPALFGGVC